MAVLYSHEQKFKTTSQKCRFSVIGMLLLQPNSIIASYIFSLHCFAFSANFYFCSHFLVDFLAINRFFEVLQMGKKKSLSEVHRAQIVALHGQNLSERLISAQIGCSKTAVHQAIAKYQEDGSYTDRKRSGRPRVSTAREDNLMRRIVMRSPTSSMKKIKAELLRRGRKVSHMTVSRRLSKKFNLKSYKSAKKNKAYSCYES